ncbi:MAG TPA: hypothetical protein VMW49_02775 [Candidatus Dormibacteraeota bacterium]|nr:hypothetical protein [Candidatus Dormibacteraeota bacterium]
MLLSAVAGLTGLLEWARVSERTHADQLAEEISATADLVDRATDLTTSLPWVGAKIHAITGAAMTVLWARPGDADRLILGWSHGLPAAYEERVTVIGLGVLTPSPLASCG